MTAYFMTRALPDGTRASRIVWTNYPTVEQLAEYLLSRGYYGRTLHLLKEGNLA